MKGPNLLQVVNHLQKGPVGLSSLLVSNDPFEHVLFENVAYLVDDARRLEAFENLRKSIGTRPEDILTAGPAQFESVVKLAGSDKKGRVAKLIRSAEIAMNEFDGDLRQVLVFPFKKAVAALTKFPSIGEPGAEKILLFCGMGDVLPLESNGLRVLVRLGYAQEAANYNAMYKNVRNAIAKQILHDQEWLIDAHLLLRLHGQAVCKRTKPLCSRCILLEMCMYGQNFQRLKS
jgi:endonuclease-3